ncbi:hypothetical protein KEM54_006084 [Ascosphaera aggregata]|nr:hypothetical protein KEM54_006084 [Ascosphaera aggregata]
MPSRSRSPDRADDRAAAPEQDGEIRRPESRLGSHSRSRSSQSQSGARHRSHSGHRSRSSEPPAARGRSVSGSGCRSQSNSAGRRTPSRERDSIRSRNSARSRSPTPPPERRRSYSRSLSPSRSRSVSRSLSPRKDRLYRDRSISRSPVRERPQTSSKIVVEKLTKNVTEAHLHEIFGEFGDIQSLELPMNHHFRTNRGTAYIVYFSSQDAEAAVAHMHEAQLDGAVLNVSIVMPRRAFSQSPPPIRDLPRGGRGKRFRSPLPPAGPPPPRSRGQGRPRHADGPDRQHTILTRDLGLRREHPCLFRDHDRDLDP